MLEQLKKAVCEANLQLVREGLVIQTFGNVSGVDRASGNLVELVSMNFSFPPSGPRGGPVFNSGPRVGASRTAIVA